MRTLIHSQGQFSDATSRKARHSSVRMELNISVVLTYIVLRGS